MFISDWWGGENWRRMEDWMFNLLYDIWKWMLNGKKIFKFLYSKHIWFMFYLQFCGDEARSLVETKRGVLRRQSKEFCGDKARSFAEMKRGVSRRWSEEFCGDKARSFAEMKEGVLWRWSNEFRGESAPEVIAAVHWCSVQTD